LSAEWDIISEMKITIKKNNLREAVQFRHIKRHADKDHPYHKLTLMQQMNVDADKLAGEYIQTHQEESYHIVPILPNSGVQLNMPRGTVTYRLKKTVMQARPQREHQKYLCQKNNWTQNTFHMINWESHHQALNKHPKQRTILIKYVNDIAPVGRIVSKYDPKYPAGCPSCPEGNETQEHMMKFPCIK
jgi:hypothetical protein